GGLEIGDGGVEGGHGVPPLGTVVVRLEARQSFVGGSSCGRDGGANRFVVGRERVGRCEGIQVFDEAVGLFGQGGEPVDGVRVLDLPGIGIEATVDRGHFSL